MIVYILIASYAIVASLARDVTKEANWCSYKAIKMIAPWSSGCFYSLYDYPHEIPDQKLNNEVDRLADFATNGGMAPDIHFYRLQLHIKYQTRLKTNFQEIHGLYQNYTKAEHHNIKVQTEYLSFLYSSQLYELAQATLDNYCGTYLLKRRVDIVDEIKWRLAEKQTPLNLSKCYDLANGLNRSK